MNQENTISNIHLLEKRAHLHWFANEIKTMRSADLVLSLGWAIISLLLVEQFDEHQHLYVMLLAFFLATLWRSYTLTSVDKEVKKALIRINLPQNTEKKISSIFTGTDIEKIEKVTELVRMRRAHKDKFNLRDFLLQETLLDKWYTTYISRV